jgi:hypothetical protein
MPNDYSTAGSRVLLLMLMVFAPRALAQESPQVVKPDAEVVP